MKTARSRFGSLVSSAIADVYVGRQTTEWGEAASNLSSRHVPREVMFPAPILSVFAVHAVSRLPILAGHLGYGTPAARV